MNTPTQPTRAPQRSAYQNIVLTAIATILGIGLVERGVSVAEPALAQSEQPDGGGLTNRLEQGKQMVAELRAMNGRLERIEARLAQRMDVRVVDMPPIKVAPDGSQPKRPDAKPDSKIEAKPGEPRPPEGK